MKIPAFKRGSRRSLATIDPSVAVFDTGHGSVAQGFSNLAGSFRDITANIQAQKKADIVEQRRLDAEDRRIRNEQRAAEKEAARELEALQKREADNAQWGQDVNSSRASVDFNSLVTPDGDVNLSTLPQSIKFPGEEKYRTQTEALPDGTTRLKLDGTVPAYYVEPYYHLHQATASIRAEASTISDDFLRGKFIQVNVAKAQEVFAKQLRTAQTKGKAYRLKQDKERIKAFKDIKDYGRMIVAVQNSSLSEVEKAAATLIGRQGMEEQGYHNLMSVANLQSKKSIDDLMVAYKTLSMEQEAYEKIGGRLDETSKMNMKNNIETKLKKMFENELSATKLNHARAVKEGRELKSIALDSNVSSEEIQRVLNNLKNVNATAQNTVFGKTKFNTDAALLAEDLEVIINNKATIQTTRTWTQAEQKLYKATHKGKDATLAEAQLMNLIEEQWDKDAALWSLNSREGAESQGLVEPLPTNITPQNILTPEVETVFQQFYTDVIKVNDQGRGNEVNASISRDTARQVIDSWDKLDLNQKGQFARMINRTYGDDHDAFFEGLKDQSMPNFEVSLAKVLASVSETVANNVAVGREGRQNDKGWDNALSSLFNETYREETLGLFNAADSESYGDMLEIVKDLTFTLSDGVPENAEKILPEAIDQAFGGVLKYKGYHLVAPNNEVTQDTFRNDVRQLHHKDLLNKGYKAIGAPYGAANVVKLLRNGTLRFRKVAPNSYTFIDEAGRYITTKTKDGFEPYIWQYGDFYTREQAQFDGTYNRKLKEARTDSRPALPDVKHPTLSPASLDVIRDLQKLKPSPRVGF